MMGISAIREKNHLNIIVWNPSSSLPVPHGFCTKYSHIVTLWCNANAGYHDALDDARLPKGSHDTALQDILQAQ